MRPYIYAFFVAMATDLHGQSYLDDTFAVEGILTLDIGADEQVVDQVLLDDGRVVVAVSVGDPYQLGMLARLQPNGALDPTFGEDGLAFITLGGYTFIRSIAVSADGRLLVAGSVHEEFTTHPFVARLLSDGSMDPTFGTNGSVVLEDLYVSDFAAVLPHPDGRVYVAGHHMGLSESVSVIARFNTDGSFDQSFGDDGQAELELLSGTERLIAMAPGGEGSVYVLGRGAQLSYVARVNNAGTLDTQFGDSGVLMEAGNCMLTGLLITTAGDLLTAGTTTDEWINTVAIRKYSGTGIADPGFGDLGVIEVQIDPIMRVLNATPLERAEGGYIVGGTVLRTEGFMLSHPY